MMSAQEQLQLTEKAVMMRGLSGILSKVALLLWANMHCHLLHPLVETRLNVIPSSQMTQVDELVMCHAQSFTKKQETVASIFFNADEKELYHAQSQEQPRPAATRIPKVCAQLQLVNDRTIHLQTPPASLRAHVEKSNVKMA